MRFSNPWRPTRHEISAAAGGRSVRDVIGPGLSVLFVGINPGLYSGAIGHHFGRPGNRFWPALHAGGFTPHVFSPFEESRLLELGLGITNLVDVATAMADELSADELRRGAKRLERKVRRHRPRFVAILGVTSFRIAFARPKAALGSQPEPLAGAAVWVLPNPSGVNAHHQPRDLARMFTDLRIAAYDGAARAISENAQQPPTAASPSSPHVRGNGAGSARLKEPQNDRSPARRAESDAC